MEDDFIARAILRWNKPQTEWILSTGWMAERSDIIKRLRANYWKNHVKGKKGISPQVEIFSQTEASYVLPVNSRAATTSVANAAEDALTEVSAQTEIRTESSSKSKSWRNIVL